MSARSGLPRKGGSFSILITNETMIVLMMIILVKEEGLFSMIMIAFQQDLKRILDLGLDASEFQPPSMAFMRLKDGEHCICMPSSRACLTRSC